MSEGEIDFAVGNFERAMLRFAIAEARSDDASARAACFAALDAIIDLPLTDEILNLIRRVVYAVRTLRG